MSLPSITDYRRALQHPEACLLGLKGRTTDIARHATGEPLVFSGNFVAAFKVSISGKPMALRCFHRPVAQVEARLNAYCGFLEKAPPTLKKVLLGAQYMPKGIRLNGVEHPVVWMPWKEARPLRDWVVAHLQQADALRRLQCEIQIAASALESAGAVHGDLQARNILVDSGGGIALVDYDGFTVPDTRHLCPTNAGHPCFQHPAYDPARHGLLADRFPTLVFSTALEALCWQPGLWEKFGRDGEGVLFEPDDLNNPTTSGLFQRLRQDPNLIPWVRRMEKCLALPVDHLPSVRELIQPPSHTQLPGLGQPLQRQNLSRLLEAPTKVATSIPPIPLPVPAVLPSTVPVPPESSHSLPARSAPAVPMDPNVGMVFLIVCILFTFGVRGCWASIGKRKSDVKPSSINVVIPAHGEGKTEAPWHRYERVTSMRMELRKYLELNRPNDVKRMLTAFDQEVARLGPDGPDLEDRLQRIVIKQPR